jgi:hypothetical protein
MEQVLANNRIIRPKCNLLRRADIKPGVKQAKRVLQTGCDELALGRKIIPEITVYMFADDNRTGSNNRRVCHRGNNIAADEWPWFEIQGIKCGTMGEAIMITEQD